MLFQLIQTETQFQVYHLHHSLTTQLTQLRLLQVQNQLFQATTQKLVSQAIQLTQFQVTQVKM